ncbi:MAG: aminopeptidase [Proteobacteria bacterium]|nr:aminopeptidase [Pseudomonadota bacterium]
MKNYLLLGFIVGTVLLTGCETRSISDSGYRDRRNYYGGGTVSPQIRELNELDVLGIRPADKPTEEEIRSAAAQRTRLEVKRGARVMLIQSGAQYPDAPMVEEVEKYFAVTPFSGVPTQLGVQSSADEALSARLRLAAARGGVDAIICYWGVLESGRVDHVTKTISWVPVVSWFTPDETQQMRIRLKAAVVEVKSGNWTMLTPAAFEDEALSTRESRARSDQKQVEKLKAKGYAALAKALVGSLSN